MECSVCSKPIARRLSLLLLSSTVLHEKANIASHVMNHIALHLEPCGVLKLKNKDAQRHLCSFHKLHNVSVIEH